MHAMAGRVWAGAQDMSGPLTRQSLLVAGVCLIADALTFHYEAAAYPPVSRWALLAAIVLVDGALASAARLSGVVALAQAAVAVTGAALLPGGAGTPDINDVGVMIAAYRAGAWLSGVPAVASLLCLGGGVVAAEILGGAPWTQWRMLLLSAVTHGLVPWLVGRYTTARRAYIAELEQQSERDRHDARQALAEAIAEERSAIARDLHDVIAHHVSAIGVHAGAARLGFGTRGPAGLAETLTAVESSSRAAMADLRRLLDFLHGNHSEAARQPGLDNLDELLETIRTAGLKTHLTVLGVPQVLPGSLDIAVYRIAQEMLTNALRHGGSHVELELRYDGTSVTATATNPLPAAPRPGRDSLHRGLEGIRSRAEMFNGSVGYGPTADGTHWTITVSFPLDRI